MSIFDPIDEARRVLALDPGDADPASIKRAYRRALGVHPPDTDPEGFRLVRDAYELLRDPWARANALLKEQIPQVPPPAPPGEIPSPPRGATAIALLRLAVQSADTSEWAAAPPEPKPRPRTRTKETP